MPPWIVLVDCRASGHMEEQTIYRECTGECCPRHCHVVATWRYGFHVTATWRYGALHRFRFSKSLCCFFGWVRYLIFFVIVNIFFLGGKSVAFGKENRVGKRARAAPCCARCTPRAALTRSASHADAPRPCAQHHSACAGPRRRAAHRVPILKN